MSVVSCSNDVYNPENDHLQRTTDLQVPQSFDWNSTHMVKCDFSAPVDCIVDIYGDEACKEGLATYLVEAAKENLITLELPVSSESFYVQYATTSGLQVQKVAIPVTQTRAEQQIGIRLPEEVEKYRDNPVFKTLFSSSPSEHGFGTLMFEDLYPALGDYDFNDFVVQYNTTVKYPSGVISGNFIDGRIIIKLKLQAIGGTLPYQLALELSKVPAKMISDNIEINAEQGLGMQLLNKGSNAPAVLLLTGTENLKDKGYFNVLPQSDVRPMPSLTCTIKLKAGFMESEQEKIIRECYSNHAEAFNFFLRNSATGEEIHLKGYPTSKLYTGSVKWADYHNDKNFVWGIKIPAKISHPIEKIDIKDAYPQFASWVTSGGKNAKEWYNNSVADKLSLIHISEPTRPY